jgi:hypothetical protein
VAGIGRMSEVERVLERMPGVVSARAAVLVDGLPGTRSARIELVVDDGTADAPGALARAALDALRVAGAPPAGSLAMLRPVDGILEPVPPARIIAAARLERATAAGDEVLWWATGAA